MGRATTLVVVAIVALLCIECSWTIKYEVGDSQGWDATTDLTTWVSNKTFKVGDTLLFKYSSVHSVVELDKAGYDACSAANAVNSYTSSPTTTTLSKAGKRYFICGSPGHCAGGMKLEVDTLAATSPAPTPASGPAKAPVAVTPSVGGATTPMAPIPATLTPGGAPTKSATSSLPTPVASPHAASGATAIVARGFVALVATTIIVALSLL